MPDTYSYTRHGRKPGTLLLVGAIWLALAAAYVVLDASPVLIGVGVVATVPAVWDVLRDTTAMLTVSGSNLGWTSGRQTASIAVTEIKHVRLDTRLDLSVRATVVLLSGRKIRIPLEATPPHRTFETALNGADIKTERHHFVFWQ